MKKNFLPALIVAGTLLAAIASPAEAQNADQRTALGVHGSVLQYRGNLGTEFWDLGESRFGGGLSLSRYLSPSFDAGIHLNYGGIDATGTYGYPTTTFTMDGNMFTGHLGLKLKMNSGLILKEDARIAPYLLAGVGLVSARTDGLRPLAGSPPTGTYDESINTLGVFGAAGIRVRITDGISLNIQTGQHYPFSNNFDGIANADDDLNDRFLQHQVGLTFGLGKARDTDGDGVRDQRDKCPDTPAGVQVDRDGCPLDGDGDGVPDYLDRCPTEAGLPTLQGCPDRDGDGVADAEDECPDQPGTAATRGCPDADGDGVPDKNDRCPDTAAGVPVDQFGCPLDADGDGVSDSEDKCPDQAGPASNFGCPEIDPVLLEKVQNVEFEFDRAVIRPVSYPVLDNMTEILKQYPHYNLRITGHADSRGPEIYNLDLSERRAQNAESYFTERGVSGDRILTEGFGEERPIAPNTTPIGRFLNRRVEFNFFIP